MNDTADSGKSMTAMMMTGVVIVLTIVFLSVTAYLYKQASTRRLPDRDVLQRMYKEGNGEKWEAKYSSNWLQPCPISQWAGIEGGIANGNEHVLEILMRGNRNFTGMLLQPMTSLLTFCRSFPKYFSIDQPCVIGS